MDFTKFKNYLKMNRKEAKMSLDRGYRLTHRHFSGDEWVENSQEYPGKYLFENGNVCSPDAFWRFRNNDNFDKDWSIKPKYAIGHKFATQTVNIL